MGSLECWKTSWRTRAERMMLHVLEGGCSVPVGCETTLTEVFVRGGEGDSPGPPEAALSMSPKSPPTSPGGGGKFKPDTHGLSVTRDPAAPRVPVSPEMVNDVPPLSMSPRSASFALPPQIDAAQLHNIAEPDDTTGIPAGHPAVNPAHVCPVTGRMLPGAKPLSPPALRNGAPLPGVAPPQQQQAQQDEVVIPALSTCTHRPGRVPHCPASAASDTPVTHHATLTLTGTITSLSGTHAVMCTLSRRCHSRDDAEQLGADVARELVEGGGREILTELGRHVKEVGGGDEAHDGREIPVEAPGAVNGAGGGAPVAPVAPVAIPIAQGDATAGGAVALSPSSASKSPAKSPHSQRTVFRGEGDKCLRPAGW